MSTAPADFESPLADLSNWRLPPSNAWAFHHIESILPVVEVANDPGQAWSLPVAPRSLDGFELKLAAGRTIGWSAFLQATHTDALVVLLDGRIVHESYANGMDGSSRHILMSATKSVVGLLAGILAGRGDLDLDVPVATYVPELAGGAYETATARQLLDMRFTPDFSQSDLDRYHAAPGLMPPSPYHASAGLHAFFTSLKAAHRPYSGAFRYNSANTDLLGWAMERASGRPLAALLSELLWKPMGAERAAALVTDRAGAPWCTGGLCATARDLARIGQLVVDGGARGADQVIPASWIDDIAHGGDPEAWATGEFAAAFAHAPMRYRSCWYVLDRQPQLLYAMGVYGQNLFVDRANRLVIAKLSSQPVPTPPGMIGLTHLAVPEIRRCMLAS